MTMGPLLLKQESLVLIHLTITILLPVVPSPFNLSSFPLSFWTQTLADYTAVFPSSDKSSCRHLVTHIYHCKVCFLPLFFLINHYVLEQFLHPSLLLNFRPSSSAVSRDWRLPPAQACSLSLLYGPTASSSPCCFKDDFTAETKQEDGRKGHTHRNCQRVLSLTPSQTTVLITSVTVKKRHLEDICISKPFRSPLQHLCLAELSHHTLSHEGLRWCTGSLSNIEHMFLSARSFSLGLFIRKDVSVRQFSLTWPGCSAQGRHQYCAISPIGCLFFPCKTNIIISALIIPVGFKPLVLYLMETLGQTLSWYKWV